MCNNVSSNIFKYNLSDIRDLNVLRFNLSIFNSDKVIKKTDQFIKIIRVLITELFSKKFNGDIISNLIISGKCTSAQLDKLNLIFDKKSTETLKITFENLFIDYKYPLLKDTPFDTFIYKFPHLSEIDITISFFSDEKSFIKLLKNKIVKEKLTSIRFYRNDNITTNIVISLSKLKTLTKLDLDKVSNYEVVLNMILLNISLKKKITNLSLKNTKNDLLLHPYCISDFENITRLSLDCHNIPQYTLSLILSRKNIQRLVKELIIGKNNIINPNHAQFLSNFEQLERLDLRGCKFIEDSLLIILRSPNLRRTIKDISFYDPAISYTTIINEITCFNSIERLYINLNNVDNKIISMILTKKEWHTSVKEIYLYNLLEPATKFFNYISNFELLEAFGIIDPGFDGFNPVLNIFKKISHPQKIKKMLLRGFLFEENDSISVFSSFENLEVLDFSHTMFNFPCLFKILKNYKKTLKEFYLMNIPKLNIEDAIEIANFEILELLKINGTNFNFEIFNFLFGSKNLHKSITKLSFTWNFGNRIENLFLLNLFSDFEKLESLKFFSSNFDLNCLKPILQSEKIRNSLVMLKSNELTSEHTNLPGLHKKCFENRILLSP
ncbi:hypothetical protein DMUE_2597 [Dictyocoela muelleri]|nr:hypothetical protein DMUE_2597 [Dictyocoela muelleri]